MPQANQTPDNSPDKKVDAKPARRKRRRWPWVLLVLFLLLLGLVALAPTLAGTGPVKSIILGKVNENLNGRLDVGEISVGWLSKISLGEIKVYDEQNALILDVPSIKLGVSLIDVIKGNFSLGDDNVIEVANFVIKTDSTGESNLQKLPKKRSGAPKPAPTNEPASPIPNISGTFTVKFNGTIAGSQLPEPIHVRPSSAVVKIPNINQPIENIIKLVYQVGSRAPSEITISGTVDAIENNLIAIESLVANESIELKNVDLSAASPFMQEAGKPETKLSGIASGSVSVKAVGLAGLEAAGQIVVDKPFFAGGAVGADQISAERMVIPINITRAVGAGGEGVIKIEKTGVEMTPLVMLSVSGEVSEKALQNLAAKKSPGAAGTINIDLNVPELKTLAEQLKNTLALQKGVTITGGTFSEKLNIVIAPDAVNIDQNLVVNAQGTNAGKPITLKPITVSAKASARSFEKAIPDLSGIVLDVKSEFVTITGGGESLAKLNLSGNTDLGKLQAEIGQFVDFGKVQLQGLADFALATAGDLTNDAAPIDVNATVNLQNVKASLATTRPVNIDQDRLAVAIKGKLNRNEQNLTGVVVDVSAGESGAPILTANATGDFSFKPAFSAPMWTVQVDTSNLAALQKQYAAFLTPLNEQKIAITNGGFHVTSAGTFDGKALGFSKPINISAPSLTVTKDGKPLLTRETIRATFNDITYSDVKQTLSGTFTSSLASGTLTSISIAPNAKPLAMIESGTVDIQAPNLAGLYGLANVFSAPSTQPVSAGPAAAPMKITSGGAVVKANLKRENDALVVNVSDLQVTKLAIAQGDKSYAFDPQRPIKLQLAAKVMGNDTVTAMQVSTLSGDLGVATLEMPKPIDITGVGTPSQKYYGSIKLAGKLEDVTPLLAVLQQAPLMPYAGKFEINQDIATSSALTTLAGAIDVTDFKVLAENRRDVLVAEPQVAIRNAVDLDLNTHNATVRTLTVDMPRSGALGVKVNAQVIDWATARTIRGAGGSDKAQIALSYDLEKLWPIIRPMLAPATQEQYKNLKIAGKYTKTFNVYGAYPDKPSAAESLVSLNADGGLALDLLELPQGLKIESFELPVELKGGVLKTLPAPESDKRKLQLPPAEAGGRPRNIVASTAVANGGALNFDKVILDLTKPDPLLWFESRHILLRAVGLNTVLAESLGKIGAFAFLGAERAEGLASMTILECNAVPVGSLMQKTSDAKVRVVVTVENLELNGAVPKLLSSFADFGTEGIKGAVAPSTIVIDGGEAKSEFTLNVDRLSRDRETGRDLVQALPLKFTGGLNLSSLRLNTSIFFPPSMIRGDFGKFFPRGIEIPMTGTTGNLQFDFQRAIRDNALPGLLNGATGGANGGGNNDNPLGGVLDGILGGDRRNENPQRNDTPPRQGEAQPRRGGAQPQRDETPAARGTPGPANPRNQPENPAPRGNQDPARRNSPNTQPSRSPNR